MENVLARTIWGESERNDDEDAIAIAHVINNRAKLPNWPNSVDEVALQKWQFSCWNHNNPHRQRLIEVDDSDAWFVRCKEIAEDVLARRIPDPTSRSTHYYATYIDAPRWARGKMPVYQTPGGRYTHLFFNDVDTDAPNPLDIERPLNHTRTVVGGQGAIAALVGSVISVMVGLPLIVQIMLAVGVLGFIGFMIYARIDDRNKGYR